MIKLDEILKIEGIQPINLNNLELPSIFTGVSIDSRRVKKGELFIAIKGENTDGHNYIYEAFKKGSIGAIVSEKWFSSHKIVQKGKILFTVKDTIKALGELAKIHRNNFSTHILCVGGSNGKTSTKEMIAAVLGKKFVILKTEGSKNNHIGVPLTLLQLKKSHQFCIVEIGSNHFGEIKYLCEIINPDSGLVTNIGREHLEFFGDLNGVMKEEFELYDYLLLKNGLCFANYDDVYIRKYFQYIKTEKKVTYGQRKGVNILGKLVEYTKDFQPIIKVNYGDKNSKVKINGFGKTALSNGLAAIATGLTFEISMRDIKDALAKYKPDADKRMEVIKKNGVIIINDTYNSNPDSVRIGLETLKEYHTKGNKFVVLGDMLEMGKVSTKVHYEVGKLVKEMKFKNFFSYGEAMYEAFRGARGVENNFYFTDKEELAEILKIFLRKGDVVYIKGSRGMKMEEVTKKILETK
ncbi:MAG: UDP-N-acetylmuramoyl-tripeptide--D-alanyl-D-alanine ligase [Ignavibacteria bacterium]